MVTVWNVCFISPLPAPDFVKYVDISRICALHIEPPSYDYNKSMQFKLLYN